MEDLAGYILKIRVINSDAEECSVFTKAFLKEWLTVLEVEPHYNKDSFKVEMQRRVLAKLIRYIEAEIALVESGEAKKTYKKEILEEILSVSVMLQLTKIVMVEEGIPILGTPPYLEIEKLVADKRIMVLKALKSDNHTLQEVHDIFEDELAKIARKENEEIVALDKEIIKIDNKRDSSLREIYSKINRLPSI